jgi:hypothetical protein
MLFGYPSVYQEIELFTCVTYFYKYLMFFLFVLTYSSRWDPLFKLEDNLFNHAQHMWCYIVGNIHNILLKFSVWNVAQYSNFLSDSLQSASHSHNSVKFTLLPVLLPCIVLSYQPVMVLQIIMLVHKFSYIHTV